MEQRIVIKSEEETSQLAKNIVPLIKNGMTILLDGDLGSGKTFFTSCIINELAKNRLMERQNVVSPTFNLLKIYDLQDIKVYHYDLYRIKNVNELYELSIEEAFENVSIIEWPELVKNILPSIFIYIKISFQDNCRVFNINYKI